MAGVEGESFSHVVARVEMGLSNDVLQPVREEEVSMERIEISTCR